MNNTKDRQIFYCSKRDQNLYPGASACSFHCHHSRFTGIRVGLLVPV